MIRVLYCFLAFVVLSACATSSSEAPAVPEESSSSSEVALTLDTSSERADLLDASLDYHTPALKRCYEAWEAVLDEDVRRPTEVVLYYRVNVTRAS